MRLDVFNFIVAYKKANDGISPSIQEIMGACNLVSSSTTLVILRGLRGAGMIKFENNKSRSIKVVGGTWSYQ